jgi:hypothetical protein
VRADRTRWYANNKKRVRETRAKWRAANPTRNTWGDAAKNSKKRGHKFDMPFEEWDRLASPPCTYCGNEDSAGLDRIDNSRGYSEDNTVPACGKPCNNARNDMTQEEFRAWIRRVYKHWGSKDNDSTTESLPERN